MKKTICIIMLVISIFFLCSCDSLKNIANNISPPNQNAESGDTPSVPNDNQQQDNSQTGDNSSAYTIKDYFPFNETTKYEYEGTGNEYASYNVWVDYINGDRIQLRKNNGGTETVKVLENNDGELKVVFSKDECYYRENFTSKPSNADEVLLKEPLVKGTSWTLSDGSKRYISNTDAAVTTPLGDFKALEVTTEQNGTKSLDYYALNTGLIQSKYTSSGMEVTSSLSKVTSNSPLTQQVKFYYPNINDGKLYFVEKSLTFKTNDLTKMSFEKIFKEAPSNSVGKLLGPDVKIKSLYLNKTVVYVDFTKELVTEMNAGSGYEAMILQCIANTLGNYYNANEVYITVEDKPYSSGHIVMDKGETIKVDTKNSVELKK